MLVSDHIGRLARWAFRGMDVSTVASRCRDSGWEDVRVEDATVRSHLAGWDISVTPGDSRYPDVTVVYNPR